MKRLVLFALTLVSCVYGRPRIDDEASEGHKKSRIVYVGLTATNAYVIDPIAHNCFFMHAAADSEALAAVPCESLLADPTAAQHLTWLQPGGAKP